MTRTLTLMAALLVALPAQTVPTGQMTVLGKTVQFIHVYAFATEGFIDKKRTTRW